MPSLKLFAISVIIPLIAVGNLNRIQKALEKKDFEKAEELLMKGYEKNPENPGIPYLHAVLLFNPTYRRYHPDSARIKVNKTKKLWEISGSEVKEELTEANITERSVDSLFTAIQDYFFDETVINVTGEKIRKFRSRYSDSPYEDLLTFKNDSLDFLDAREIGTQDSYLDYIATHPISFFNPKADSALDFLRFEELESSGTLSDYYSFRATYPQSKYLTDVEEYILKVSTASHTVEDIGRFIRESKVEKWKRKAKDVLFFFDPSDEFMTDSMRTAHELHSKILFPTSEDGQFGFVNVEGVIQIKSRYQEIQERDKCGAVTDNWIFVRTEHDGQIILKDGSVLIEGVNDYKFISKSVGLLEIDAQWFVFHKSGFKIIEMPVDEVEVFDNQWMSVSKDGRSGLYTLLGVPIAEIKYDDIYKLGTFWVFEKNNRLAVYTKGEILKEIEDRGLSLEFKFDELELVNEELLIGFKNNEECLLDKNLQFLIPWGKHEIFPDPSGWYLRSRSGYALYSHADQSLVARKYPYIESNDGWLALQTETDWILRSRKNALGQSRGYDSVKLISPYVAMIFENETKSLLFPKGKQLTLETHLVRSFPEHPSFVKISNEGSLGLYDQDGTSVFEGEYDNVTFLTDSTLKVTKDGKIGLASIRGEFILNPIFDSIDEKEGLVSTLYKGKIGCYDLENNVLISPEFDARISRIGPYYYTKKGANYGLIDGNEEEILNFSFDEITFWNDTSYLVKKEGQYEILNSLGISLVDPFTRYTLIYEEENQQVFSYVQDGKFGLRSNVNGDMLKPEFTDIMNIGTENLPIFFADQHLSQAGYHVVSYMDKSGNLIYSKAYRKDEFEEIICSD